MVRKSGKRRYEKFKKLFSVFFIIVILTVPFFIYSLISNLIIYNENYYEAMFERHDVNVDNRTELNREVLDYFRGNGELSDSFNEREVSHLIDVKRLLNGLFFLMLVLLFVDVLLIVYLYRLSVHKKKFLRSLFTWSGLFTVCLSLIFVLMGLFFQFCFRFFHKIFFEGDSWLFYPYDLIINLYPFDFFRETFILFVIVGFSMGLILTCIGLFLNKR